MSVSNSNATGRPRWPVLSFGVRMKTPEELLDEVVDRDSFIAFVNALAAERLEAEEMERDEPVRYQLGGAHNWQNGTISSFLYGGLAYFDPKPVHQPEAAPSWKMLADFLYHGKIYE